MILYNMTLVIIDFNGTVYDPEHDCLMPGAKELLDGLKAKGIKMVLVSKQGLGREGLPAQLGIAEYFAEILFVEQKTRPLFLEIMHRYGAKPEETYVIGDYPRSEIRAGNEAGAFTIHFIGGRYPSTEYSEELEKPDAQIERLNFELSKSASGPIFSLGVFATRTHLTVRSLQ